MSDLVELALPFDERLAAVFGYDERVVSQMIAWARENMAEELAKYPEVTFGGVPTEPRPAVLFYWTPFGDELCWEDGRSSVCGANHWAWLDWIRGPLVQFALVDAARELGGQLELGTSETEAQHALVIDQVDRKLLVGDLGSARAYVAGAAE